VTDRRKRLLAARLYLVCDSQPDAFLEAALRGGVDIVQLRMKDCTDARILSTAARFAAACSKRNALFILNDRPDLVAHAGADGVHVGQDDMPVEQARALVGSDRLVGLSTHSPAQVEKAAAQDVDYIGVGPVHATPTKPGRPPVGLELVRYAAERAHVASVIDAGARRIAVVRALTQADDPERVARELCSGVPPNKQQNAQPGVPRERVGAT